MSLEAMKQALEALEAMTYAFMDTEGNHGAAEQAAHEVADNAITNLRQAIEQAEKQDEQTQAHPEFLKGYSEGLKASEISEAKFETVYVAQNLCTQCGENIGYLGWLFTKLRVPFLKHRCKAAHGIKEKA